MISTIIWLVGVVLCIKACLEIWKFNGDTTRRILLIILILITSWVGLAFYYFYGKDHLAEIIK